MKLEDWIEKLYEDPELLRMGHHQRAEDRNLGLGWLYYGFVRALRLSELVVIGSFRGFVPLVLARALADNREDGRLTFIDPSLVDDFWADPPRVAAYFASHGLRNVSHHQLTTQDFRGSDADRAIEEVDLLFVDGYHSAEQARFDFETFADRITENGIVLFHDSVRRRSSGIYGKDRRYEHTVVEYMDELKQRSGFQLLDVPVSSGVTVLRRC